MLYVEDLTSASLKGKINPRDIKYSGCTKIFFPSRVFRCNLYAKDSPRVRDTKINYPTSKSDAGRFIFPLLKSGRRILGQSFNFLHRFTIDRESYFSILMLNIFVTNTFVKILFLFSLLSNVTIIERSFCSTFVCCAFYITTAKVNFC